MSRGEWKSSFFPESRGTVVGYLESTLWGMATGEAVVLDIVLRPAEIAPASCQPLQAAWSSLVYGLLYTAWWHLVGPTD